MMAVPSGSKSLLGAVAGSCIARSYVAARSPRLVPLPSRRCISVYGYTQAKCLIFRNQTNPNLVLDLHTHSLSPPHGNLITLRTLAAPLNPADINQIQGSYPTLAAPREDLGTTSPVYIPGNEGCFEVLSVGSDVRTVAKGDWVIPRRAGLGTWRTHLQISEDAVTKIEDKKGLTPLQVGTVGVNPVTAWRMLKDFEDLKEGDWWIQNGANSGVGRAALQLSKAWGLKSIAVVRRRRTKEEHESLVAELKGLGANLVVPIGDIESDGTEDWKEQVKEVTGGAPVKLALNCVGGKETMRMAKVLGTGGTLVTYGGMSKQPLLVGAAMMIFKDLKFKGFWVSRWADQNQEEKKKTVEKVLSMYKDSSFRDVPYDEVKWEWDTEGEDLAKTVRGTLDGFRTGKGVFVFGDT